MSVIIPCLCPPKGEGEVRHPDGDTVELRESLSFAQRRAIRDDAWLVRESDPDASTGEVMATLTMGYVIHGVTGWSVVDVKGKPLECTRENIRGLLLDNDEAATIVSDEADALYAEAVMLPLLKRASPSSKDTPRDGSTSPTTDPIGSGNPTPIRQSKRSSTGSTRTAATATTPSSRAGDSSSSHNSASVA